MTGYTSKIILTAPCGVAPLVDTVAVETNGFVDRERLSVTSDPFCSTFDLQAQALTNPVEFRDPGHVAIVLISVLPITSSFSVHTR